MDDRRVMPLAGARARRLDRSWSCFTDLVHTLGSCLVSFLNALKGYRTYIVAAGLAGLGVAQLATGQIPLGLQTLLSALATAGLRGAIASAIS
jgi:hypothetical protein